VLRVRRPLPVITTYVYPLHTTATVTDSDTYLPADGTWINTKGATSVTLLVRRTAETGTCTLDFYPQWLDELGGTFIPLLDENDGTAMLGVQYTNGTVDTTGYRLLTIKEILPVGHTTGKKVYGTNYVAYQAPFIPEKMRFRFRHGGTSVTNTFGAYVMVHTIN
jgi:hypothetical protein